MRRVEGATDEFDDFSDLRPANICMVAEKRGKNNEYLFNRLLVPDCDYEADFVYYNAPEVVQERARFPSRPERNYSLSDAAISWLIGAVLFEIVMGIRLLDAIFPDTTTEEKYKFM